MYKYVISQVDSSLADLYTGLNINLNINEKQDCKIGTVRGWVRGECEWRRLRWWYMVDGLHIPKWNRTKKPLVIALSGAGKRLRGRNDEDNVTNVQYKSNWNCHHEFPPCYEYILIKFHFKKEKIVSVLQTFRMIWRSDMTLSLNHKI
jgi:hypothetical protein